MILYPAIDISEGRAVRLRQGRFDEVTVYQDDPLEAARSWAEALLLQVRPQHRRRPAVRRRFPVRA